MESTRAAGGTACSQTRLKSETCTTTEPSRERNTSGEKRERGKARQRECSSRRKKVKYAGSRQRDKVLVNTGNV